MPAIKVVICKLGTLPNTHRYTSYDTDGEETFAVMSGDAERSDIDMRRDRRARTGRIGPGDRSCKMHFDMGGN